jgi:uncharacterized protein YjbI with pentapeptide repeats
MIAMDRAGAMKLLKGDGGGIAVWNEIRTSDEAIPDLAEVDLTGADLRGANFSKTKLARADLLKSDFRCANLSGTDLRGADLRGADLSATELRETDFTGAIFKRTVLGSCDLSACIGLASVVHKGPSQIGVDTLLMSKGKIPDEFLRGCGVPDLWIVHLPALISNVESIQFYSCFISYSTKDEEFAKRLHARMVHEKLRVWFAPEDVQGGKKLHEQIDQAIRVYDKLLLVLSPHSMGSEWVMTEIRKARKLERQEGKRKLFPIRLMDFGPIRDWEYFDDDGAQDLVVEIRENFIPDFSNWKDHDAFEAGFAHLLKDLKTETPPARKGP